MLGYLLAGLFAVAVVATVIVVSGMINKQKIKDEMRNRDLKGVIIKEIDRCDNKIKLEDLYSDETYEIQGDDISYELDEDDRIYI